MKFSKDKIFNFYFDIKKLLLEILLFFAKTLPLISSDSISIGPKQIKMDHDEIKNIAHKSKTLLYSFGYFLIFFY